MNKKMRLWVAGTVGVLMTGLMSVNAYALEEKDVIGTWYVNELSMGGDILFHPGVMGMEVTVDIKEGGQMETIMSYSGEEPEVNQLEWKIENDKFLMTYDDQTEECEYTDGKITITADGTTMIRMFSCQFCIFFTRAAAGCGRGAAARGHHPRHQCSRPQPDAGCAVG